MCLRIEVNPISRSAWSGRTERQRIHIWHLTAASLLLGLQGSKGNEQFGEVVKLNPKTAGVLVGTTRWKVSYGLLSSIIEGELGRESNVIEGQPIQGQLLGKE